MDGSIRNRLLHENSLKIAQLRSGIKQCNNLRKKLINRRKNKKQLKCARDFTYSQLRYRTNGFRYMISKPITKHALYMICQSLTASFENRFGQGYYFQPDGSVEGGLQLARWPGYSMLSYEVTQT